MFQKQYPPNVFRYVADSLVNKMSKKYWARILLNHCHFVFIDSERLECTTLS